MFAVPSNDDTEIKSLKFGEFVRELGTSRYSINVTWTGPVFNFTLISYNIEYELTGYQSNRPTVQINVVWWLPLISIGFIVLIFLLIARVTEFFFNYMGDFEVFKCVVHFRWTCVLSQKFQRSKFHDFKANLVYFIHNLYFKRKKGNT